MAPLYEKDRHDGFIRCLPNALEYRQYIARWTPDPFTNGNAASKYSPKVLDLFIEFRSQHDRYHSLLERLNGIFQQILDRISRWKESGHEVDPTTLH